VAVIEKLKFKIHATTTDTELLGKVYPIGIYLDCIKLSTSKTIIV
jgi:hypothetical protein